ncbi:DUF2073 domain-containing protein [Candidatus Woesearchaeota archaeon]|nr:DUF2073 domain-containing protein [Candidatus Woesearchaeota archaeon]
MITIQFLPYSQIGDLSPEKKIKRILEIIRDGRILLIEAKLTEQEKSKLISATMETINGKFKGIELLSLTPDMREHGILKMLQQKVIDMISGGRNGITIVGPATIVKEIKKDPDKIQLFTVEKSTRRKRTKQA